MKAIAQRATGTLAGVVHMKARERMQLWMSLLEQSEEGIMVCDPQQRIVIVNPAFEKITGYSAADAAGQTPRLLHSGRQERSFYEEMWSCLQERGRWSGEIWNRRKTGEVYVQWLTVQCVRDPQGKVTHYLGVFSDLTQHKAAQARMRYLLERDPLTLLPNRSQLLQKLQQLTNAVRGGGEKLAVLCVDLDRFSEINDSMGNEAGDLLLQIVARRIRSAVRHSDVVARTSADEFIVLLPGLLDAAAAESVTQAVLKAIREPMTLADQDLAVSASAGLCICPDDGMEPETLARNAVAAMQSAKRGHRGAYQLYAPSLNERAPHRLRLENALRLALEHRELALHYQPQIDLTSGKIVAAEALVRWHRPGIGMAMPGEFIPLAEETGLIVPMGRWAIAEALQQMQAWDASAASHLTVAVNVSAVELRQPDFADNLAQTLDRYGIDPARLELELTESIAVHDIDATVRILSRLHGLGVRLSLDDFGTGYSSLNYLSRFPIDKVKIDRSFITDMTCKPQAVQIVRAIVAIAATFGMKVIAEGVESAEQLAALRTEGCQEIQGYIVSRPLPPAEFDRFVREWNPLALQPLRRQKTA